MGFFFRSTEAFSHRNPAFAGISNEQSSPEHSGRQCVCLVMNANYEAPHYAVFFSTLSLLPVSRNVCIYSQKPFPKRVRFVCAFYNWRPISKTIKKKIQNFVTLFIRNVP